MKGRKVEGAGREDSLRPGKGETPGGSGTLRDV